MVSELVGVWLDGGIKRQGRERVRDGAKPSFLTSEEEEQIRPSPAWCLLLGLLHAEL